MMPLAMSAGGARFNVLRWGLCFAAVAAAHGAGVTALIRNPAASDSDFLAGAPVVMIDLAETPAAAVNPPSDLAPGPDESQSEQTPPPQEETKPPEQVAEVALPEPEPPKPEPPAEEKPATALPSVAMAVPTLSPPNAGVEAPPSAAVRRWASGLYAHIARLKRYPAKARVRGDQGTVRISVQIDREGRVLESHVVDSSGSSDLDQEFLSMVARAQPLPKPPPDAKPADLEIIMAMNFSVKRYRSDSR